MLWKDLALGFVGLSLILAPFVLSFYSNSMFTWASIGVGMMFFVEAWRQVMQRYEDNDDFELTEEQE